MHLCQIRETSASSGFENFERKCLKSEAYDRFFIIHLEAQFDR